MVVPTTVFQLAAVLLLVVPGIVYTAVRRRLGGPTPEDQALSVRLTRAVGISVVLDLAYGIIAGPWLVRVIVGDGPRGSLAGLADRPRLAAAVALVLLVLLPAGLAGLGQLRPKRPAWWPGDPASARHSWWREKVSPALHRWSPVTRLPVYHPTPSAWDRAATDRGGAFVRVFTDDGYWVGGFLGDGSYISTYPQPRDLFIPVEWTMSKTGDFLEEVPDSLGVYVPLSGKERVAWINPPDQSVEEPPSTPGRSGVRGSWRARLETVVGARGRR